MASLHSRLCLPSLCARGLRWSGHHQVPHVSWSRQPRRPSLGIFETLDTSNDGRADTWSCTRGRRRQAGSIRSGGDRTSQATARCTFWCPFPPPAPPFRAPGRMRTDPMRSVPKTFVLLGTGSSGGGECGSVPGLGGCSQPLGRGCPGGAWSDAPTG